MNHETMSCKVSSRFNNFHIFSVYRNPDLDNTIYDCLLSKMANIQSLDPKAAFVFVGDLNANHREYLNSVSPTNQHGRAALDFSNLSGCEQIVSSPTHVSGNRLDLCFTDVPGVVNIDIVPPLGTSDHSTLSIKLHTDFILPNLSYSRTVFLKSRINWPGINSDFADIQWRNIYNAPCPVAALNSVLVNICKTRVPSKLIKTRLKDEAWFNDECRQAQRDKQTAYRLWSRFRTRFCWENYTRLRADAKRIYSLAETEYNNHLKEVLTGTAQPHKWWPALKKSLFGVDNSLPPLSK